MKQMLMMLVLAFGVSAQAYDHAYTRQLKAEFESFYKIAKTAKSDGKIGGFLNFKKYDGYELTWRLGADKGDYDVISLYVEKPATSGHDTFQVTYYRANHIVKGEWVIRRFVGPGQRGWRNDTVSLENGQYYGFQGAKYPVMDREDAKLLKLWGVKLFDRL